VVAIKVWECQSRGYSQSQLMGNLLDWAVEVKQKEQVTGVRPVKF
jgi:hypothetical protein